MRTDGVPLLQNAVIQWRKAAAMFPENPSHAVECNLAARSLELEIETGESHCVCHLIPLATCPKRTAKGPWSR
jgi:hypothetical protein